MTVRPPPSVARGFLFADLRDYSAWVERHGDHAAAELLRRYRAVIRRSVSEFDGSEIKTEGDSFYVVFGSPSAAIRCGLRILELAAAPDGAGEPIAVGVGVHAGEAVVTDEGYVGSVVNVAARVCAQAGAGELLVTDAVRSMTRTYLDVTFSPRGRKRLKGILEPVALYQVVPVGGAAGQPRRLPIPRWAAAGVLAVVVVASAFVGGALIRESAGQGSTASAPPETASRAPSPSTSAPPGTAEVAFPTELETDLLALLDESDHRHCERAAAEDVPVLAYDLPFGPGGAPTVIRATARAGIFCELGGITAPDQLWFWQLIPRSGQRGDVAGSALATQGGRAGATPGSCREQRPSIEDWTFGGISGRLLCYETSTGDAVVVWSYDDDERMLFAKAVRDDRDISALLDWWESVGRFAAP